MERSQMLNLCEMAVFRRWSLEDYVVLSFFLTSWKSLLLVLYGGINRECTVSVEKGQTFDWRAVWVCVTCLKSNIKSFRIFKEILQRTQRNPEYLFYVPKQASHKLKCKVSFELSGFAAVCLLAPLSFLIRFSLSSCCRDTCFTWWYLNSHTKTSE